MRTFEEQCKMIEQAWAGFPATIRIRHIEKKSEMPKWKGYPKDQLDIGIKQGTGKKQCDTIYAVRRGLQSAVQLNCTFEDLDERDLGMCGVMPSDTGHLCKECGEFSVSMHIDGRCAPCGTKKKEESTC